jgi:hypothetical protein
MSDKDPKAAKIIYAAIVAFFTLTVTYSSGFAQNTFRHPLAPSYKEKLIRDCAEISETYIQQIDDSGLIDDVVPAMAMQICQEAYQGAKVYRLNAREISCYQTTALKKGLQTCWRNYADSFKAIGHDPTSDEIKGIFLKWQPKSCATDLTKFHDYLASRVVRSDSRQDECYQKFGDKTEAPTYSDSRSKQAGDVQDAPSVDFYRLTYLGCIADSPNDNQELASIFPKYCTCYASEANKSLNDLGMSEREIRRIGREGTSEERQKIVMVKKAASDKCYKSTIPSKFR